MTFSRGSWDTLFPHCSPEFSSSVSSCLRAAPLLVYLYFVLDPIVQLKVVVLQRRGGARGEPAVGARAVEEQTGTNCTQQDTQRAHHDDGEEDGIQCVQPGVVLVFLRHQGDGRRLHIRGGGGEGGRPPREDVFWKEKG